MWELFQLMGKDNLTPNQCLLLFAIQKRISVPQINQHLELKALLTNGYVETQAYPELTNEGKKIIVKYNNYFIKSKKKSNNVILGKEWQENLTKYREFFPAKKLPSGKPARNNITMLAAAFRWFFENYDYTWEEIHRATAQYVDQYEQNDYKYMKTSQYFIAKEDKTKVKYSELADYCDMIREGLEPEQYFKEKVV